MRLLLSALLTSWLLIPASLAAQSTAPDKFFDSNGVQIRYVEQGVGDPIILAHGLGESRPRRPDEW